MIRVQPKPLHLSITGFQVTPVHGYAALQGNYELKDGIAVVAKGSHREWSTETRDALQRLLSLMEGDVARAYGDAPVEYEVDPNAYGRPPEKAAPAAPADPDLNDHLDDEPSPF